jgi:hypothetical protein
VDVLALGAFEGPQIGTVGTGFDLDQPHAALTRRAAWSFDRDKRWFGAGISSRHGMHLAKQEAARGTLGHR